MSKNIQTLDALRKEGRDSGGESDGDGEREGFYVGGSEHSGQQVLGPERPPRSNADIAEQILNSARQHGAEALNAQDLLSPSRHGHLRTGSGVRLNEDLSGNLRSTVESNNVENDTSDLEEVVVEVFMWDNGFSVDDGPLRPYDGPSREFLESIMQGRVPTELMEAHPRRPIDLRLKRRSGPYEAPKLKPFQGAGARLGVVVPNFVSSASVSSSNSATDSNDNLKKAQDGVFLDNDSPVTQIQIRLPNGQRLSGRFNHSHTVDAIRTYIVTANPELAALPFQLMTTFPNKVIDDETVDLKEAGLINTVVIVKLCD